LYEDVRTAWFRTPRNAGVVRCHGTAEFVNGIVCRNTRLASRMQQQQQFLHCSTASTHNYCVEEKRFKTLGEICVKSNNIFAETCTHISCRIIISREIKESV